MKVDGGCYCGDIRYEAEVDPAKVVICHCTDCQTMTGSAFRTVVQTVPGTFRLLSGKPTDYVKSAASGNSRQLTFCPVCGTPLYSGPAGVEGAALALRVGSVHQRDLLIPSQQYWCRSSQAWLADLASIPRQETQPAFNAQGSFDGNNSR
jgi:hypothetical protein